MAFDYESETKARYQSDDVATVYHKNFTKDYDLKGIRSRIIASAERRAVANLLARTPHEKVLDVPTGTGKLAPVFSKLQSKVMACDISPNMLEIARSEYAQHGCHSVDFSVQDAADLSCFSESQFDTVVCLRLVHRVPSEIRMKILSRLSSLAPYTIISYGIDSPYHNVRRTIRSKIIGEGKGTFCACTLDEAKAEVEENFRIKAHKWVIPLLSAEIVFLLESKK